MLCYSTGFGRTGVFLTLSIVLEQMRYEAVVDMFQTVKMLRTQRPAMVQTEVVITRGVVVVVMVMLTLVMVAAVVVVVMVVVFLVVVVIFVIRSVHSL